jgi:hypothetical protein
MKKFIRELRRREVFRTAGLYVGIGWILIEAASVVAPIFDIPGWVLQFLVIAVLVGFPVMLVLAWVYDVSDKGLVVQADATDTVVIPFGGRNRASHRYGYCSGRRFSLRCFSLLGFIHWRFVIAGYPKLTSDILSWPAQRYWVQPLSVF